jgi:hypothetical protein
MARANVNRIAIASAVSATIDGQFSSTKILDPPDLSTIGVPSPVKIPAVIAVYVTTIISVRKLNWNRAFMGGFYHDGAIVRWPTSGHR